MSSAGLKTKTKRVSARSPYENTTPQIHADEDVEMDDETSSDEESVPEKGEDELKLERMLFGDDEGFMGALKAQQEREGAMQLTLHSDAESASADEEADDETDLNNMADADVCGLSTPTFC
jgi:U3 small nucleolar RNA-associated protein 18